MFSVVLACLLLIGVTTLIHYEVLGLLSARLPGLRIPRRSKLLAVIFGALTAHALEIAVYGFTLYGALRWLDVGQLRGSGPLSLATCLYFSAETYTSLGFGDLAPSGPVRLLAGVEALNGLLLIGWSSSYTYIAMERFWGERAER